MATTGGGLSFSGAEEVEWNDDTEITFPAGDAGSEIAYKWACPSSFDGCKNLKNSLDMSPLERLLDHKIFFGVPATFTVTDPQKKSQDVNVSVKSPVKAKAKISKCLQLSIQLVNSKGK